MGSFVAADRFDKRIEKIKAALKHVGDEYNMNRDQLEEMYRHYRLIEAEINGQDLNLVFQRLEEDFKK